MFVPTAVGDGGNAIISLVRSKDHLSALARRTPQQEIPSGLLPTRFRKVIVSME